MDNLSDVLKSLTDETRLRIINLLFDKEELCVCDIMQTLQVSQSKASRHLIYLKNAGLVKDRKSAQWVYYSLSLDKQFKFIDSLVYDGLRNMELYKKDLENLKKWLQRKDIDC
jgi:DNA-binding transcriptional ArsR family regulator